MVYPFWGSLLLGLEAQQSNNIPTMATDGITLYYNPDYVLGQRETIVCTDQAHEAAHRMFRDHLRRGDRDPKLWNVATDYRINLYLRDSGLELGDDYLVSEQFRGCDAEEIYDFLKQNPNDTAAKQAQQKGGCGCGGLKDHPSKGSGQPSEEADLHEDGMGDDDNFPSSVQVGIPNVDFGEAETLMAIAQARAFAKGRGTMPGDLNELVDEILDPKIRWEQVVQRFMENCCQDDFSWNVPDRRFLYMDMYLPGLESDGIDTFVVAVDTSGSTVRYVPSFLGAVNQLAKVLKFKTFYVMYCDAEVQHVDEYTQADMPIRANRTYGGGGTDFRPVFNWLTERGVEPKGMIYLTDTDGNFPKYQPSYPVLWVVPGERERTVPWGETIQLV